MTMDNYMTILVGLIGKSGSGKDTLYNDVMRRMKNVHKVIHYTTRLPRSNEVNGEDYYFVTEEEYLDKLANNCFLVSNYFNGWYYGIAKSDIKENRINFAVLNVTEAYQLQEMRLFHFALWNYKIETEEKTIKQRLFSRGDDIEEIIRRMEADNKDFETHPVHYAKVLPNEVPEDELVNVGYLCCALEHIQSLITGECIQRLGASPLAVYGQVSSSDQE